MRWAYKLSDYGDGYVPIDGTDRPRAYDATLFDKNHSPEKGRYVCACCGESVKWIPYERIEGGFKPRKAHWTAVNRGAHLAKKCTAVSTEDHYESLSAKCNETQAIGNRTMTILIRVNFDTRHGLTAFNQRQMTDERRWCRKHHGQYKPKVIHDMDELVKFINKLFRDAPEGREVQDRVMVSHGGKTRALSEVLLLEPRQRRRLYQQIDSHQWQKNRSGRLFKTGFFPCIIPFGLDYSEKKTVGSLSRVFNAARHGENLTEILRMPELVDGADLVSKSGYVIAWPYLSRDNPGKLIWYVHDMNHISTAKINRVPHPEPVPHSFKPTVK